MSLWALSDLGRERDAASSTTSVSVVVYPCPADRVQEDGVGYGYRSSR